MQMLSQRIAKGAQQAVLGTPEAFKQLQDSRTIYKNSLSGLMNGNSSIRCFAKFDSASAG